MKNLVGVGKKNMSYAKDLSMEVYKAKRESLRLKKTFFKFAKAMGNDELFNKLYHKTIVEDGKIWGAVILQHNWMKYGEIRVCSLEELQMIIDYISEEDGKGKLPI